MTVKNENMAIDADGRSLPYSPAQVTGIVQKAVREGELLAVVVRMPDGDLAIQVLGEPCADLATALERAARAYRNALKGH